VLDAAKQSIRQGFRDKASLPVSDPSIQPAIQHAEEVASFLKANVVQGKREGDNTYSEFPRPEDGSWHATDGTSHQNSGSTSIPSGETTTASS